MEASRTDHSLPQVHQEPTARGLQYTVSIQEPICFSGEWRNQSVEESRCPGLVDICEKRRLRLGRGVETASTVRSEIGECRV
jgi:hypothetical protein